MTHSNPIVGVDLMRTLACMSVLMHHYAQKIRSLLEVEPGFEWIRFFDKVGDFGVGIFFVLSGYLLGRPYWKALDAGRKIPSTRIYIMRRAARILPGYYFALVLSFVTGVFLFDTALDFNSVLRLMSGLSLMSGWHWVTFFPVAINSPLWSISFEALCYLFLPLSFGGILVLRGYKKIWLSRLLWAGVIGLALLCHWLFIVSVQPPEEGRGWNHGLIGGAKEWMPEYNPFGFYAMFAIGTLAASLSVLLRTHPNWKFDILAALFLTGAAMTLFLAFRIIPDEDIVLGIPYGFPVFHVFIAAFLVTAPLSRVLRGLFEWKIITFISTISFGIYLYHQLVIELSARFLINSANLHLLNKISGMFEGWLFVTLTTIVLALVSYVTLERPAVKWARRQEWKLKKPRYE